VGAISTSAPTRPVHIPCIFATNPPSPPATLLSRVRKTDGNRSGPVHEPVQFPPQKPCLQIREHGKPAGFTGKPARFLLLWEPVPGGLVNPATESLALPPRAVEPSSQRRGPVPALPPSPSSAAAASPALGSTSTRRSQGMAAMRTDWSPAAPWTPRLLLPGQSLRNGLATAGAWLLHWCVGGL
jgi:hypothetical protein